MQGRLENIRQQVEDSGRSGLLADLRYLLARAVKRDRVIGSLSPRQWRSIASRVPPGRRKERDVLNQLAALAEELREEAGGETRAEDPQADD